MTAFEWRITASLAAIYAVRMLGLFMILPVFSLYAKNLAHTDATPVGLAIGVYGLTQALFQLPLGMASDRFGRKPIILAGLALFALGSLIAALGVDSIAWIIVGRTLQGMGAIAAVAMALAADLTREEYRTRVMGVIGISIALSFAVAMVVGPLMYSHWGMASIFWFTMLLALIGMLLLISTVPTPAQVFTHRDTGILQGYLSKVLRNRNLLRMDFGVFVLHLLMTANFTALPVLFEEHLHIPHAEHWRIYLPVFSLSFLAVIPFIIIAETKHKIKPLLLLCILLLMIAEILMALGTDVKWLLLAGFTLFFVGFNFLEATQPSLVAKYADVQLKGTAMGVYGSVQFLGIFCGGLIGGWLQTHWGSEAIFWFSAALTLIWLGLDYTLPVPLFYTSRIIKLDPQQLQSLGSAALQQQLQAIGGVMEIFIDPQRGTAYLKVDKTILDEAQLQHFVA